MVQTWSPRDLNPRQPYCRPERLPVDPIPRNHVIHIERYTDLDGRGQDDLRRRQPPMQIDEALRLHCGIAAKRYFVTAISEDGNIMTFISPGQKLHENVVCQFFDAQRFQQVMERIEMGKSPRTNHTGL